MPPERKRRLEELNFQWDLSRKPIDQLDATMARIRSLPKKRHGRVLRPRDVPSDVRDWLRARQDESLERRLHPLVERELKALGLLEEEDG